MDACMSVYKKKSLVQCLSSKLHTKSDGMQAKQVNKACKHRIKLKTKCMCKEQCFPPPTPYSTSKTLGLKKKKMHKHPLNITLKYSITNVVLAPFLSTLYATFQDQTNVKLWLSIVRNRLTCI